MLSDYTIAVSYRGREATRNYSLTARDSVYARDLTSQGRAKEPQPFLISE